MRKFLDTIFSKHIAYFGIFLFIHTILRAYFTITNFLHIEATPIIILKIFIKGFWFDVVVFYGILSFISFVKLIFPERLGARLRKLFEYKIFFIFIFSMLFNFCAEILFWMEFNSRFNFLAIDYLIYTTEVIGNILESYPIIPLLILIGSIAIIIVYLLRKQVAKAAELGGSFAKKIVDFFVISAVSSFLFFSSNIDQAIISGNSVATELSKNGIYSLFNAFWHNEIDYNNFYKSIDAQKALKNVAQDFPEKTTLKENGFIRENKSIKTENKKNVVIVLMESMSASYMGYFGNLKNLTPNLDRLAKEGLFFTNFYATGTRTVRGIEAIILSIPPTPGQSIVRRPNNENLFSAGFIFRDKGYSTKFIYGGFGYFDNMNYFFNQNGFDIVDRGNFTKEEIKFSNIWGVSDEDLFRKTIANADKDHAENKPFMYFVLTTSNHRPYTYPEGKIDIPSKTGRDGGVKYADYSIGEFISQAKNKKWFNDTIFVFVSDHTAGAAGKVELDPIKYHIPLIIYSPGLVKPKFNNKLSSQIDLMPTLLDFLNFDYNSKFYGMNLLNNTYKQQRAFISNYQKVAMIQDSKLVVLAPNKEFEQYDLKTKSKEKNIDENLLERLISYYQTASNWRYNHKK
jgi:phosphoglycerol transferase MdoB-like AlkP superfamily enzyme